MSGFGAASIPSRQPVMPKYFEKLLQTIAFGSMLSTEGTRLPSDSTSARSR